MDVPPSWTWKKSQTTTTKATELDWHFGQSLNNSWGNWRPFKNGLKKRGSGGDHLHPKPNYRISKQKKDTNPPTIFSVVKHACYWCGLGGHFQNYCQGQISSHYILLRRLLTFWQGQAELKGVSEAKRPTCMYRAAFNGYNLVIKFSV